jgi:hypothetical protein
MARDSLDYNSYMAIARWLMGMVDSTLVRIQKHTPEHSFYPEDMQLPVEEQKLLWNEFYVTKEEVSK